MWQGVISFYIPYVGLQGPSFDSFTQEHWMISTLSFTVIVHVVTAKLFLESQFWNWINIVSAALSLLVYHGVLLVGSVPSVAYVF